MPDRLRRAAGNADAFIAGGIEGIRRKGNSPPDLAGGTDTISSLSAHFSFREAASADPRRSPNPGSPRREATNRESAEIGYHTQCPELPPPGRITEAAASALSTIKRQTSTLVNSIFFAATIVPSRTCISTVAIRAMRLNLAPHVA